jgi:hypothetical protein
MELQRPKKRVAQAVGALLICGGLVVVLFGAAPLVGLIIVYPPLRWPLGGWQLLTLAVGVIVAVLGLRLLAWGGGT